MFHRESVRVNILDLRNHTRRLWRKHCSDNKCNAYRKVLTCLTKQRRGNPTQMCCGLRVNVYDVHGAANPPPPKKEREKTEKKKNSKSAF